MGTRPSYRGSDFSKIYQPNPIPDMTRDRPPDRIGHMTVDEVRRKRAEAEEAIALILNNFMMDTGIPSVDIGIITTPLASGRDHVERVWLKFSI